MNTQHADTRIQQRRIDPLIIDWLFQYGQEVHDHRGAVIRYFDKKAVRRLSRNVGSKTVGRIRKLLDAYVVEKDGTVVTVGYRFKRVPRQ
jgi:hypothetical protein